MIYKKQIGITNDNNCKRKKVIELKLTCDIPNARRLYKKLGFEKENIIYI